MEPSVDKPIHRASIQSAMDELLCRKDDQCAAHAERGVDILTRIESNSSRVRDSSREISTRISASIEREREAIAAESDKMDRQADLVKSLEQKISTLRQTHEEMLLRRRAAEESIPLHAALASEKIVEKDDIDSRHIRKLQKIKKELSLHALMTNIKWDYTRADVLAGEVSIPSRAVHRRFVVEKGKLGEFDISEQLWRIIEG